MGEETPGSTQQQQPQYSNLSTDLMNLSLTPTLFSQSPAKGNQEEDELVPDVKLPSIKFKLTPLLSHITARGLSVEYFFGRRTSLFPDKMVSVQLVVTNRGQKPIGNIKISTEVSSFWFFLSPFGAVSHSLPSFRALKSGLR